jgi:hypothetical protein
MVPLTYPRVIKEIGNDKDSLFVVATTFSCLAALCVLLSICGIVKYRDKRSIKLAQVNFLYLLLAGLSMVSLACILLNVNPSDASCMAISWLVILGYTFELVPLLFKVAAIASLVSASKKFKRVRLDKTKLFSGVFAVGGLIVIFLILWTVLDPSTKKSEFTLTEELNALNETIVWRGDYCSSNSDVWLFISIGWRGLLLFCGTVLGMSQKVYYVVPYLALF